MIKMYRKLDRKSTFTYAATWWSSTSESSKYDLCITCLYSFDCILWSEPSNPWLAFSQLVPPPFYFPVRLTLLFASDLPITFLFLNSTSMWSKSVMIKHYFLTSFIILFWSYQSYNIFWFNIRITILNFNWIAEHSILTIKKWTWKL